MMGMQDNERFGLQDWVDDWDGEQDSYTFGQELTKKERRMTVNKVEVAMVNE